MKIHIHTSLKQQDKAVLDLDIDADSGLEVLKFQIFSLSNIPPEEQLLLLGQAAHPLKDDVDLRALLKVTNYMYNPFCTKPRSKSVPFSCFHLLMHG